MSEFELYFISKRKKFFNLPTEPTNRPHSETVAKALFTWWVSNVAKISPINKKKIKKKIKDFYKSFKKI